jgi:hypothetical protein
MSISISKRGGSHVMEGREKELRKKKKKKRKKKRKKSQKLLSKLEAVFT